MSDIFYGGGKIGPSIYDIYVQLEVANGRVPLPVADWLEQNVQGPPPWNYDGTRPAWSDDIVFGPRDVVAFGGSLWFALRDHEGVQPGTDETAWVQLLPGIDIALYDNLIVEASDLRDQAAASASSAGTERQAAQGAAERAELAEAQTLSSAQMAAAIANLKPDITAGLAATAEGGYFTIEGPDLNFVSLYRKVAGAAQYRDRLPNGKALDAAVAGLAYQITTRDQDVPLDGMLPFLSDELIWAIPGETTGPAVNRAGQLFAEVPHDIGEPMLSDQWKAVPLRDKNGNVLIGVDTDDRLRLSETVPALSDQYKWVWTDDYGNIMFAMTVANEFLSAFSPPAALASDWSATARDGRVWVGKPGTAMVSLSDAAGFPSDPILSGNIAKWMEFASGAGVAMQASLTGTTAFGSAITTVEHIIASGQSLSRGIPLAPVTIGAPDPGRLMMFDQGVNASSNTALVAADFDTLASASVTASEVPVLSAGRQYLSNKAASVGAIVSGHGVTGYSYTQLKKGTVPFNNMATAMRTIARQVTLAGLSYRLRYLSWIQGEADTGVAKGVYLGWLVEHQGNVTAVYQAIVSTADQVVLVSSQPSNFTAYNRSLVTAMVLEHLEASILYPDRFIQTGPKYQITYYDNTHPASAGFLHMGEIDGRAMRLHALGLWTGCLYVKIAARTGNIVVLTWNQPYGGAPIDLSTAIVSDPGNFGVTFHQVGGNAVTVTGVAVTGNFEMAVTLSATPTGTEQQIGIAATGIAGQPAGPTTGARSCIRSAVAETDALGRALDYVAAHQLIDIT